MKDIRLKFIVLFLTSTPIIFAGPEIEVDKDFIQGLKPIGGRGNFTFTVRNVGDEGLVIRNVKTSCGCTSAKVLKNNIAPNETTKIVGTYKPNLTQQSYNIKVIIQSNATNEPNKRLKIIGQNFPPDIEIQPRIIHASYIIGDVFDSIPITITTRAEMKCEKIEVFSGKEMFTVEVTDESQHMLKFNVTPKDIPNAIAKYEADVQLKILLDDKLEEFAIPVSMDIVPEIKIYPPKIDIPAIDAKVLKELSVRSLFKSQKDNPIKILSVESPTPLIKTKTRQCTPYSCFLYVTIDNIVDLSGKETKLIIHLEQAGTVEVLEYPINVM